MIETTLTKAQFKVKTFHEKYKYPVYQHKVDAPEAGNLCLEELAVELRVIMREFTNEATRLQKQGDTRLYRVVQKVEELEELAQAMVRQDVVKIADSLGDLLYFLLGTASLYQIPIGRVFDAIHDSNMTKTRTDYRIRDKGPHYVPPNIKGALEVSPCRHCGSTSYCPGGGYYDCCGGQA